LAYDGTRFSGFQRQASGVLTVQGELERALASVTQQEIGILAAGRTDAGVHARGQVVAFDAAWKHSTEDLWRAVNANLSPDIVLKKLDDVDGGFHPRFDALSRTYHYQFYTAPIRDPLGDHTSWYVGPALALDAIQAAADMLVGTHDFATFGQPTQGDVTVRRMHQARYCIKEDGMYYFIFEANAFLKHMVRSLMGTLVEVGRSRMSLAGFQAALASADRSQAGPTAPPHGLILVDVAYCEDAVTEKAES
jgi:tRNA pseudouridine38-40 synthase